MTPQHPTTETIIDYIHGELLPPQDAALFEHFASCAPCREEYEAELRLSAALQAAAAAETFELPSPVKAELWNRVRARKTPVWSFLLRPFVALPVAAAIAVAAFFAVHPNASNGPRPMVASQYYFDLHSAATRQENPLTDRSAPALNVIEASDAAGRPAPLVEAAGAAAGDDLSH